MVGSSDTQNNSNRVGSVLYYCGFIPRHVEASSDLSVFLAITAAVVIGLAAIVILAKWWYNRKHKREMQARIDLERQAMVRVDDVARDKDWNLTMVSVIRPAEVKRQTCPHTWIRVGQPAFRCLPYRTPRWHIAAMDKNGSTLHPTEHRILVHSMI